MVRHIETDWAWASGAPEGLMVLFALIAEVGPARATVITYVKPAVAIVLGALVCFAAGALLAVSERSS